jgi:hypothetical protein
MKKIKIIPKWKQTLRYAWSIRLAILAGLFSALEVVLAYFPDALPRGAMAGAAGVASLGAVITRFLLQQKMTDEE